MSARRYSFLLLAPLVPWLHAQVDRQVERSEVKRQELYVDSGDRLKKAVPGFENLLADVYWLRAVQYFGRQRLFSEDRRFELLYPLIDITTTLDPRMVIAYKYGAIFLCEPVPAGKGDPQAGIRMLEKGVRSLPGDWRLRQELGYFRYLFLHDAEGGARELLEAAKIPGAAYWLANLAESVLAKTPDRRASQEIWRKIYENEEGFLKQNALENLQRLQALDTLDVLNAAAPRFRERFGRLPHDVNELAAVGVDAGRFRDATGVAFSLDPASGRFTIDPGSRLSRGGLDRPVRARSLGAARPRQP